MNVNNFKGDIFMYCTNCGTQIPEGQTVCPNCSGGAQKASVPTQESNPIAQEIITPVEINNEAPPVQPEPTIAELAASEPVVSQQAASEPQTPQAPVPPSGYDANPKPQAETEANYGASGCAPNNNFGAAPSHAEPSANYSGQPAGAPVYQTFNQYQSNQPKQVVTTGQWILRMLINLIPCVGPIIYFIMLFIWANDKTKEDTSSNWAKAQLIWMAISLGIGLLLYIIIFAIAGLSIRELVREPYQYNVRI